MGGIYGEYFFAKGWTSPTVLMLQTVVDPSIKGITVAMFLFFSTVVGAIAPIVFGIFYKKYDASPHRHPDILGNLMSVMTIIPCAISIPLFLIAGLKYRKVKLAKDMVKIEIYENKDSILSTNGRPIATNGMNFLDHFLNFNMILEN